MENSTEFPQKKMGGCWNLSGGPVAKSPRSSAGAHVSSLVRELGPMCWNEDGRSHVPQLRPGTAKKKKKTVVDPFT